MPRLVALFLLVVGAILVATGLRQSTRARETRGWTRTTGRILESRVTALPAGAPGEDAHPDRFGFLIRYAYDARGRTHESTQVWIGSAGTWATESAGWPRRWVERFPAGSEAPVWFDPRDPAEAVLLREIPGRQVGALLAIGGALVAIGLYALGRMGWR